jgi:hypothetical protein
MTDEAISPLRRRMIEDMTIRKFSAPRGLMAIRNDGHPVTDLGTTHTKNNASRMDFHVIRSCQSRLLTRSSTRPLVLSPPLVPSPSKSNSIFRSFFDRSSIARCAPL